ncbi:ABC transporter substrate-binding protein [Streptomyces oceani]|uniref:Leucine-binding protein domain-containing protein n=1 Tax=Streptomyces oceani TaxID=1075402 RepID=A0A1E7KMK0_9ACTN|nr:ABC transporter substrate-binding protein [Streptomyces oceani]OEV05116.1 hypothetical protein AN216_04345 [Streptomyces oceani]
MTARRRAPKATALAAATAGYAALLSGCGSVPAGTGADTDPITVMTWAPQRAEASNMPGMPAMGQAYARWFNARGGINGRELEVLTCDERNDSVGAARCADRAVEEEVVAVVGSYSQHGRSFMSALEGAGIPYLGGYGVTEEEYTSPLSYPVNGGQPVLAAANGRQLAAEECSRVSLVRPDTITGDQLPPLLDAGLRDGGAPQAAPATDVRAPESATSYQQTAQRALEGALGAAPALGGTGLSGTGRSCVTAMLGGHTDTFLDSFRRAEAAGESVRTASVLGSVRQSLVDRTGGADSPLEGTYVTSWYPPADDPRWDTMREAVREHAFGDNRIDPDDPGAQTTWIAYTALRAALEQLDPGRTVTAEALRTVLDEGEALETGGLTPKLRWHYEDLLSAHDYPRLVNTHATYQRVRNGQVSTLPEGPDGFVDVEKSLENKRDG